MGEKGNILAWPIEGEVRYAKMIFAIGMYERQSKKLTPEFERDVRQYMEEAFGQAFHNKKTQQLRIVPVNKQIAIERGVTTYDQIRAHVEASPGPFGAITCICRHGKDLTGESCKQTKLRDNCLMIGQAARWAADSGMGQAISREQMLDLLDQADKEGLVLEPENTKSPMFVCCLLRVLLRRIAVGQTPPQSGRLLQLQFLRCRGAGRLRILRTCEVRCQMDAITSPEGKAVVDRLRCIGCALCVDHLPLRRVAAPAQTKNPESRPTTPRRFTCRCGRTAAARGGWRKLGCGKCSGSRSEPWEPPHLAWRLIPHATTRCCSLLYFHSCVFFRRSIADHLQPTVRRRSRRLFRST